MVEENKNISNEQSEDKNNYDVKSYEAISERLKEIEDKISSEEINMEESLKLYEEAVNLGMKASQTVENNALVNYKTEENQEQ